MRPGPTPLRALAAAFNPRADDEGAAEYAKRITKEADELRTGDPELLSHMIREALDQAEGKPDRLLLYIDKWEELYAQAPSTSDKERVAQHAADVNRFIDLLLTAARTAPVAVVATVRADFYDPLIGHAEGKSGERLFFELALEDLTQAADLFWPVYDRTCGVDGWISLEVSPLLAHDTKSTIAEAKVLHAQARRPNVFIKIPGTPEGLPAIEEAIFAGVPINVTLLFSDDQYLAAANAFMRGIERRIEAGLTPDVRSVASIFISRWDAAVTGKVPKALNDRLGIAIAKRAYKAYLALLSSPRWMRAYNAGARPQRLLWASTGTKDPEASDVLYVKSLAAPLTVNTMPEGTLKALADHGDVGATLPADGGNSEEELARFAEAKIDVHALSRQLQDEGAKSFVKSWNDLMSVISSKSAVLKRAS